ncbi:MAG: FGGY-family carbohydrate kinase [Promethearchaeota archaeon]
MDNKDLTVLAFDLGASSGRSIIGIWSLLGVELKKPIISEKTLKCNFTNEGCIGGTFRFFKNITGLWLIQECKKIWDKENFQMGWDIIEELSLEAQPFQFFINSDDKLFLNPPNMIKAIRQYCKIRYNKFPKTVGEISRAIFESLALSYKHVINIIEDIIQKEVKILYIIGGGSQISLLNQFTSNALNLIINAGPIEATAIGNILVQALSRDKIDSVSELRTIVRSSFPLKDYLPKDTNMWEKAYDSYLRIMEP